MLLEHDQFCCAIMANDKIAVQQMLNEKPGILDEIAKEKRVFPLNLAAQHNNMDIVEVLLDAGAVNGAQLILSVACAHGNVKVINKLLQVNGFFRLFDLKIVPEHSKKNIVWLLHGSFPQQLEQVIKALAKALENMREPSQAMGRRLIEGKALHSLEALNDSLNDFSGLLVWNLYNLTATSTSKDCYAYLVSQERSLPHFLAQAIQAAQEHYETFDADIVALQCAWFKVQGIKEMALDCLSKHSALQSKLGYLLAEKSEESAWEQKLQLDDERQCMALLKARIQPTINLLIASTQQEYSEHSSGIIAPWLQDHQAFFAQHRGPDHQSDGAPDNRRSI
jgi:hypothetical protein